MQQQQQHRRNAAAATMHNMRPFEELGGVEKHHFGV
jgi:hypothetical protein